jgi:hypothetical protein
MSVKHSTGTFIQLVLSGKLSAEEMTNLSLIGTRRTILGRCPKRWDSLTRSMPSGWKNLPHSTGSSALITSERHLMRLHDREKIPGLKALSLEEKLMLAGEPWDEVAAHPGAFPPLADHMNILQERLEHHHRHPEDVRLGRMRRRVFYRRVEQPEGGALFP